MKKYFLSAFLLVSCQMVGTRPDINNFTIARVCITTESGTERCGTGVPYKIINHTVYFLTCKHIIKDAKEISVDLYSDSINYESIKNMKIEQVSSTMDLVVISGVTNKAVYTSRLANRIPKNLEPTIAVGCVGGHPPVYTSGIVTMQENQAITSAAAAPGNSGGPIYSSETGELLGITEAIWGSGGSAFGHINLFISSDLICAWLKELP